jgi:TonB-linked SusC/RagA family outer membrane protein
MSTLACLTLLAGRAAAQIGTGSVGGVVLSEQSTQPLPNVQVSVAGSSLGAVTDASGRFRIAGITGTQVTLNVRRIGYQPIDRSVTVGDMNLRFSMVTRAVELNSVVVTGTAGASEKRTIGNAVTQIAASEVTATQPIPNLQSLIQGRAAGVAILPSSGQVGTGAKIRIRGASSLSLSNEPLIYVDGVRVDNNQASGPTNQSFGSRPISRWNDFNPDDIESIEIIKGPAAATLYGTEASNGVVQIITKKGTQGRPSWNFTTRQGANWFSNPEGRIWTNYGVDPATGDTTTIDIVDLENKRGTPIFRTGQLQQYDANVSAGSQIFRYYLAGGTETSEGAERNNDLRRYNGRANLALTPNERWDINANLGYTTGRTNIGFEAGGGGTPWTTYFATPENLGTDKRGFYSGPPEAYYAGWQSFQDIDRFTGSIVFNNRPFSWFNQRLTFGTDQVNEDNQEIGQKNDALATYFSELGDPTNGYMQVSTRVVTYNTYDYAGTARTSFGTAFTSTTSLGAQYYSRLTRRREAYGEGFPATGLKSLHSLSYIEIDEDDRIKNSTVGLYVQEQVGWNNRLFLTGAVRGDDNSAFGANYKAAYYPKASVAYVVSEEPFWNVGFVNSLKLRAAYGQSGQQPDVFASVRTFVPGGGGTVTPGDVGNPDLGPERSAELELGFDAAMLDDRLSIEFTSFNDRTTDAILTRSVPPSTGFAGFQYFNAGEVTKNGLELLLRGTPVSLDNVALDLTLSVSRNSNKIKNLGGAKRIPATTYIEHRVGYPVGSWFGKKIISAQLDADGNAINAMCSNGAGGAVACSSAPDVYLGNTTPKSEGGFQAGLTLFKNFRLNTLLDFKGGYKKLDGNRRVRCNLFAECRINYYPKEFDPRQVLEAQNGTSYRDFLIRDASFTKLREVSATYTIPDAWVSRARFSRASVTLAGRNLHTWTKWQGLEPEASFNGGTRGYGQWEQDVIPQLMQFVGTLNLSF